MTNHSQNLVGQIWMYNDSYIYLILEIQKSKQWNLELYNVYTVLVLDNGLNGFSKSASIKQAFEHKYELWSNHKQWKLVS